MTDKGKAAFKSRMTDWTENPPTIIHAPTSGVQRADLPQNWICASCRRLRVPVDMANPTCDAFPLGLPDVMLMGLSDHKTPLPGDGGLMYDPLPDAPKGSR